MDKESPHYGKRVKVTKINADGTFVFSDALKWNILNLKPEQLSVQWVRKKD